LWHGLPVKNRQHVLNTLSRLVGQIATPAKPKGVSHDPD
jgi:hypothetical protein